MSASGEIVRVAGALAEARPLEDAELYELVRVGRNRLLGEVVRVAGDVATVQLFEETAGLGLGEPVERTGGPLTLELGPGLLGAVLDGVGRPLHSVAASSGPFVPPGADAPTLDRDRRWTFRAGREAGEKLEGGDLLGSVETPSGRTHRILVPPGTSGKLSSLQSGEYGVEEAVGELEDGTALRLSHAWPVRTPRPVARRIHSGRPLVTGQRVLDFLFPVAEGGTVAVPGGFGTGKTVIEQSLARYVASDVVVFIGCGERGNEMAEVVEEFPELEDPRTGASVMDRTVLIVNTSNMPVAARESSVYLGITVAEYFRDQGFRVAVMADSLSRWAEALREIASRMQELPGEEGYPTYLGNRLAKIFERAGRVRALGSPERRGAVSLVAAVSPPGGDFSEPVTQASLRVAGALWALDPDLAHQRQFPAVDWQTSYSLYADDTSAWFAEESGTEWGRLRGETLELLQQASELRDVASLVGPEALEDRDRLLLAAAGMARDFLLSQNAFDRVDAYSPPARTAALAGLVLELRRAGSAALEEEGITFGELDLGGFRAALRHVRRARAEELTVRTAEAREILEELASRPTQSSRRHGGEAVSGGSDDRETT